jgi:hypothetical protein
MQVPAQDPLTDRLALTVLVNESQTTVHAVADAAVGEVVMAMMPQSVAAILCTPNTPAGADTITVKIQGRNKSTDAWTDVGTFTAIAAAAHGVQRMNLTPVFKRYKAVITTTGAFTSVSYEVFCAIAGTDVMNAPITQV